MEGKIIEYYDRATGYHGVGNFYQEENPPIKKGDRFIVPPDGSGKFFGCLDGRENHPAYMKPLLLTCNGVSENHVVSDGHGSFRKDLCYFEKD